LCYLLARKFAPSALQPLLELAPTVLGFGWCRFVLISASCSCSFFIRSLWIIAYVEIFRWTNWRSHEHCCPAPLYVIILHGIYTVLQHVFYTDLYCFISSLYGENLQRIIWPCIFLVHRKNMVKIFRKLMFPQLWLGRLLRCRSVDSAFGLDYMSLISYFLFPISVCCNKCCHNGTRRIRDKPHGSRRLAISLLLFAHLRKWAIDVDEHVCDQNVGCNSWQLLRLLNHSSLTMSLPFQHAGPIGYSCTNQVCCPLFIYMKRPLCILSTMVFIEFRSKKLWHSLKKTLSGPEYKSL
jgi:hypothetical protein